VSGSTAYYPPPQRHDQYTSAAFNNSVSAAEAAGTARARTARLAELAATRDRIRANRHSVGYSNGMRSAAKRYGEFCEEEGLQQYPATYESVSTWMTRDLTRDKRPKKLSSCFTDKRNLSAHCDANEHEFLPEARDRRLLRQFEQGAKQTFSCAAKRPPALTVAHLLGIADQMNFRNPAHTQVWLHMALAHQAMLRGGDGTRMHRRDITFTPGGMTVRLMAKGHRATPRIIWVSHTADPRFDIPELMKQYLEDTGIGAHPGCPLFAKLQPSGKVDVTYGPDGGHRFRPLSYDKWRRTWAHWTKQATIAGSTPHAARAGGITDGTRGGGDPLLLSRIGGWAVNGCWHQYVRPEDSEVANMLRNAIDRRIAEAQGLRDIIAGLKRTRAGTP